jgi:hypothetical protein
MFSSWGLSVPQTRYNPLKINQYCSTIAEQCQQRNIYGYIDIDFIVFVDKITNEDTCWATDLSIGYSEHMSHYHLMHHVTKSQFHVRTHSLTISMKNVQQRLKNWQSGPTEQTVDEMNN